MTAAVPEQVDWRSLLEQMHEGFVACELLYDAGGTPVDYRYLEANARAEQLAGVSAVGRRAYELHPQLEKFWLRKFARIVETGEPAEFTHFAGPLGRWFHLRVYRYAENRFAILFLDVTERKAAEAEARRTQATLLKATRLNAIGAMASTLAHELSQPLAAAVNYLNVIDLIVKSNFDAGAIEGAAAAAKAENLRAGEIIKRVKLFALEGRIVATPQSLREIIESAAAGALGEASEGGILLRLELPAELIVPADKVQLEQVFSNLFKNAATAMRAQDGPRQITVTARPTASTVQIKVQDTGPGISKTQLPRIFEAFHSNAQGTGLGLPICRAIVEAHRGTIEAVSSDDGAEFQICLPKG